jgi:hypothetical protein
MPFVLIIAAAVLLVAGFRNTQGDLATALATDAAGFAKWFLALAAVGGLGFVPGLRTISRWMLALIVVVLVLRNYQQILKGFADAASGASAQATTASVPTPAAAFTANPITPQVTAAELTGSGGAAYAASGVNAVQLAAAASPYGVFDPATVMTQFSTTAPAAIFDAGLLGFGGVA